MAIAEILLILRIDDCRCRFFGAGQRFLCFLQAALPANSPRELHEGERFILDKIF